MCIFFSAQLGLQTHLSISYEVFRQHYSEHTANCNDDNDLSVSEKLLRYEKRQRRQGSDRQQKRNEAELSFNEPLNSCTYSDRNIGEQMKSTNCNEGLSAMNSDYTASSDDSFFMVPTKLFIRIWKVTNDEECNTSVQTLYHHVSNIENF